MTRAKNEKGGLSRRGFLSIGLGASLAGLFGQASVALFRFFKPRIPPGSFGGKVNAGTVEEFEPGTINHIPSGRFYLSRLEDGSLLALWHRCTHLGCTIPWREEGHVFHCPCHSSIFNEVGEVISGPAPRPMDLFPVAIEEGEIVVDTGSPIQRTEFDPSQGTSV